MNSRNRRQQVARASQRPAAPTAATLTQTITDKFSRLAELKHQINQMKALYQEHDALQSELLQLFIQKTDSQFTIARSVAVGNRTYRLTPFFYDSAKGTILSKRWKSTAHETFTIE